MCTTQCTGSEEASIRWEVLSWTRFGQEHWCSDEELIGSGTHQPGSIQSSYTWTLSWGRSAACVGGAEHVSVGLSMCRWGWACMCRWGWACVMSTVLTVEPPLALRLLSLTVHSHLNWFIPYSTYYKPKMYYKPTPSSAQSSCIGLYMVIRI